MPKIIISDSSITVTDTVKPNKVCPVVLKNAGGIWLILAFRHPIAGCQLVKGTIEAGESAAAAALRELFEESGVTSAAVVSDWGIWESGDENQI